MTEDLKVITNPEQDAKKEFKVIVNTDVSLASAIASEHHAVLSYTRSSYKKEPLLVISSINEEEGILLGRFQNQQQVLKEETFDKYPVYRRFSGGSAAFMGKGSIYMFLILPNYANFITKQELPSLRRIPRFFFQYIHKGLKRSGLNFMMSSIGIMTKKTSKVGVLSFDIIDDTLLIECWLGMSKSIEVPEEYSNYPYYNTEEWYSGVIPASEAISDPLPAVETIAENIRKELLELFNESAGAVSSLLLNDLKKYGVTRIESNAKPKSEFVLKETSWNWLDKERIQGLIPKIQVSYNQDIDPNLTFSRLVEDGVGFIQAAVRLSRDNIFDEVKIFGDFYADNAGIRALERKLRYTVAHKRSVSLIIDSVLGSSDYVIKGIKRLGSILEAIMDAVAKSESKHL